MSTAITSTEAKDCFFQAMIDSAKIGVLAVNNDGYLIYINSMARSLLTFQKDIKSQKVHYASLDYASWNSFKEIMETGEPQIGVPVMTFLHPFVANRSPILIEGQVIGLISVFHKLEKYENISDYLQKYRYLVKQTETLIDSSYDGIFVTDANGIGIRANPAYDRITGVNSSELIGRNMRDLEKEGLISESVTLKVLKSKKRETISQTLNSGKEALITGNPIFDDKGKIIMVMTNLRDMTDLNSINRELAQSREMTSAYKEQLRKLHDLSIESNELVVVSKAMQNVHEIVKRVSATDATVFIQGETGVGKEKIVEEIHHLSKRSKTGILVKINCGTIPESLLESELFGYDEGAFTGARKEGKPGLFEIAQNGTLFLDEVDSMSLVLQTKLLRVLQDFEIRRVGSTVVKTIDTRLICASNHDMKELILKKKFRADLFYRLNVIPIHIPPLIGRKEDILRFISIFLKRFNQKHFTNKILSKKCIDSLLNYSWPGNVRELANIIERVVVLTPENDITEKDMPSEIHEKDYRSYYQETPDLSLREQLKRAEREIVSSTLKKYGNARQAALHLKVNPSTICRKLRSFNQTDS